MPGETHCPLCAAADAGPFHRDQRRSYLRCGRCRLVFVPPEWHLDPQAELAHYRLHRNDPDDPGYRRFLSRLSVPLLRRVAPPARGLDFGCGPGPALAALLREAGLEVALYDPFFAPDRSPLEARYDFVTATEVVEHLRDPRRELERLWSLLLPGGWLGIMTKLVRDREAFAGWHYKNDPTHIGFFSRETWRWWGLARRAPPLFEGADVILLRKPAAQAPGCDTMF
jgi:SAM-dependent methyltransferase